ncbi:DNA helicase RecQ [Desulfococcus sp.]|uniref:DNA helicase RecQ n=1 Tax=Desulfococcus sp. TaxID=2025834 RepID=UPI00359377A4
MKHESDIPRIPPSAEEILRTRFGYPAFREHQEAVIRHLVRGGDAFVLMPTGSGKSLCYQIPAMIRPGVGVVVSPLIALMQDQTDALRENGIHAEFINSTLSPGQIRNVEARVRSGRTDLLYVAPERLTTPAFLEFLGRVPVALFAIDEAHCISQWGHDFRPEYLMLSLLSRQFPGVPRIALTATADPATRKEIVAKLGLQQARSFVSSFDRPNICYRAEPRQSGLRQLAAFLKTGHDGHSGIVYCLSRRLAESTAGKLGDMGYTALPYHAGMDGGERLSNQRRFLREDGIIIAATVAFGMGIDKPDVRFVAHMGMPQTLEAYYQETGRAGRDGEPANAWMLYGLSDVVAMRRMVEASAGNADFKRVRHRKGEAMLGYAETARCRRQMLLAYFGETLKDPCGNCDVCLGGVDTWDGTLAARKALSCVYRTGQRFGAEHLANVLIGEATEKIRRAGHDRVSTFGIGTELSRNAWRSVFRQLVAAGYLAADLEGMGGFHLSPLSRPVLVGDVAVRFRKDPEPVRAARPEPKQKAAPQAFGNPADALLWESLRTLRMELARAAGVPPYVVFHDTTLREMVRALPLSPEALGALFGVGQTKLERYGEPFLAAIRTHVETRSASGKLTVDGFVKRPRSRLANPEE